MRYAPSSHTGLFDSGCDPAARRIVRVGLFPPPNRPTRTILKPVDSLRAPGRRCDENGGDSVSLPPAGVVDELEHGDDGLVVIAEPDGYRAYRLTRPW